jgi:dephospho-CoA kinase
MIGITGGIASGKSTVAGYLKSLGYPVLDADKIVSLLVLMPKVSQKIIKLFGSNAYLPDGSYNRTYVREKILETAALKKELESILHPLVIEKSKTIALNFSQQFGSSFLFYEASLIYEVKRESDFQEIIVVVAPHERKIERLRLRSKVSSVEAENLVALQMSDHEKAKKTEFVIKNDGNKAQLLQNTEAILQSLRVKIFSTEQQTT